MLHTIPVGVTAISPICNTALTTLNFAALPFLQLDTIQILRMSILIQPMAEQQKHMNLQRTKLLNFAESDLTSGKAARPILADLPTGQESSRPGAGQLALRKEVILMTTQTKQLILDATTIEEKIKAVNQILQDGEPGNISKDSYSGFTGYKPQYIIDAMNRVFHIGTWGFEEVASEIVAHQTEKGTSSLAIAHVKVWLKGIDFQPASYGQSRITKGDVGDAKKGSQKDAIKKALSYFSIGNRAYHGLLKAA